MHEINLKIRDIGALSSFLCRNALSGWVFSTFVLEVVCFVFSISVKNFIEI